MTLLCRCHRVKAAAAAAAALVVATAAAAGAGAGASAATAAAAAAAGSVWRRRRQPPPPPLRSPARPARPCRMRASQTLSRRSRCRGAGLTPQTLPCRANFWAGPRLGQPLAGKPAAGAGAGAAAAVAVAGAVRRQGWAPPGGWRRAGGRRWQTPRPPAS
eukprot:269097-Chlamydomonas_euryale.AAC.6